VISEQVVDGVLGALMDVQQPGKIVPERHTKRRVAERIEHRKNNGNPLVVDSGRQRIWIWTMPRFIVSTTSLTFEHRDVLAFVRKSRNLSAISALSF